MSPRLTSAVSSAVEWERKTARIRTADMPNTHANRSKIDRAATAWKAARRELAAAIREEARQ